ncbi:MAG: hypothetical protein M1296_06565 [Chloroflexi bacterium]|nr:hypothetical protein [Chloroflexota bacterium]
MTPDAAALDEAIALDVLTFEHRFPEAQREQYDGEGLRREEIPVLLGGSSLFASARSVVLRGIGQRVANDDALRKTLAATLSQLADELLVVFRELAVLDEHHPLVTLVRAAGGAVRRVPTLSLRELEEKLQQRAAQLGVELDRDTRRALSERAKVAHGDQTRSRVEYDLTKGLIEVEKLATYLNFHGAITRSLVEESVVEPEDAVFALADRVAERDLVGALAVLDRLLERGEPSQLLFALIVRHFRQLLWIAGAAISQRGDSILTQGELRIPSFRLGQLKVQAAQFQASGLGRVLDLLFAFDVGTKTGRIDDQQGLRLLITSICTGSDVLGEARLLELPSL